MNGDDDGQDLVADAIQIQPTQAKETVVRKTQFLPWHRPRKQHIRVHQWCAQTQKLALRRKNEFANRTLNYLGLPGDDLLDLRVLHDAISSTGARLRYLGFNAGRGAEPSISEVEVNNLEFVDSAKSKMLPDRFETLGNTLSIAAKHAREIAPFDVVNLDLCGSAAGSPPSSNQSVLNALHFILELQDRTQAGEWLLFLTTRADTESVDQAALRLLLNCVQANLTRHASFEDHLDKCLGVTAADLVNPSLLGRDEFALAFGLGIGKWLLGAANGSGNGWEVELHAENFWYAVAGNSPDMLSLSFRFSRRPSVGDKSGLTKPSATAPVSRDELTLATGMIDGLVNITDPEALFRLDSKKKENAVRQSCDLLEDARYDRAAYLEWIAAP